VKGTRAKACRNVTEGKLVLECCMLWLCCNLTLSVWWSSEQQHTGSGTYPRAETRQKYKPELLTTCNAAVPEKVCLPSNYSEWASFGFFQIPKSASCGHEYTSACAGEDRKGNGHGVPWGEMCQN